MKRKNSDRKFEARLRSGRKAIQYVRRKTEEMEREMSGSVFPYVFYRIFIRVSEE